MCMQQEFISNLIERKIDFIHVRLFSTHPMGRKRVQIYVLLLIMLHHMLVIQLQADITVIAFVVSYNVNYK